jgi:hypothetical protein
VRALRAARMELCSSSCSFMLCRRMDESQSSRSVWQAQPLLHMPCICSCRLSHSRMQTSLVHTHIRTPIIQQYAHPHPQSQHYIAIIIPDSAVVSRVSLYITGGSEPLHLSAHPPNRAAAAMNHALICNHHRYLSTSALCLE